MKKIRVLLVLLVAALGFIANSAVLAQSLSNGSPINSSVNSVTQQSDFKQFTFAVPGGVSNLRITTTASTGDIDLYVKLGSAPSLTVADCVSEGPAGIENCFFATPTAGTYFIRVYGYTTGLIPFTITGSYATASVTYSLPVMSFTGVSALSTNESRNIPVSTSPSNTAALQLSQCTVAGANANDFSVTSPVGATMVAPGTTTNVVVRFAPVVSFPSDRTATLTCPTPNASTTFFSLDLRGRVGGNLVFDALTNNVPLNSSVNSVTQESDFRQFTFAVPSGVSNLRITTAASAGDIDLYVKLGSAPSLTVADCTSGDPSGNENCFFATPTAGTYFIRVYGFDTGLIPFTITGSYGAASIRYSVPTTLALPDTAPGANSSANVPVSAFSSNTAALQLSQCTIFGANSNDFSVTSPLGATTVAPGTTTNVLVRFAPVGSTPANRTATLTCPTPNATAPNTTSFAVALIAQVIPPATSFNFTGHWHNASESGWGLTIAHQGNVLFPNWFTFDNDGKPLWFGMIAGATLQADGSYSGAIYRLRGVPFNLINGSPAFTSSSIVGQGKMLFTGADRLRFDYTVNGISQSKNLEPLIFAERTICESVPASALATASNYTDVWDNSGTEAGWGVHLTHQANTLFGIWYTYDATGRDQWLTVTATKITNGQVFTGELRRVTGLPFFNINGSQAFLTAPLVGTVSFIFSSGTQGTMNYTLDGISQSKPLRRYVFGSPSTLCRAVQ